MCTVTLVRPEQGGVRMVCNRDESRQRPAAWPPTVRSFGTRKAILPIDPVGGGTWVAVSDAGLAFTLMNVYPQPHQHRPDPPDRLSRGLIIPSLLDCDDLASALRRATEIPAARYATFRLLIADSKEVAEICPAGETCILRSRRPLDNPVFFTSSGLGDDVVDPPRRALFNECFGDQSIAPDIQDQFHRHHWADRRHLSICMSRPDARTVSLTTVEIGPNEVTLGYHEIDDAGNETPFPPLCLTRIGESARVS